MSPNGKSRKKADTIEAAQFLLSWLHKNKLMVRERESITIKFLRVVFAFCNDQLANNNNAACQRTCTLH